LWLWRWLRRLVGRGVRPARQFGDDAVLRLGDDTIRIEDLALNELSASMFLL
jgi:hypothetical protein